VSDGGLGALGLDDWGRGTEFVSGWRISQWVHIVLLLRRNQLLLLLFQIISTKGISYLVPIEKRALSLAGCSVVTGC
jgi:hypothetical protein